MTFTIPLCHPAWHLPLALLGIVILLWSGREDQGAGAVTALGWLLAGLTVMLDLMSRFGGRRLDVPALLKLTAFGGAAAGALASLATVLLMLFKNLLHSHIYPDYPPQLMLGALERLPAWGLAGGLAGLGLGFMAMGMAARMRPPQNRLKGIRQ